MMDHRVGENTWHFLTVQLYHFTVKKPKPQPEVTLDFKAHGLFYVKLSKRKYANSYDSFLTRKMAKPFPTTTAAATTKTTTTTYRIRRLTNPSSDPWRRTVMLFFSINLLNKNRKGMTKKYH